ncbi:hypothetical protein GSI_04019 [Ganoderma sinense ZZ0214-1]|uniref:Uncharacterized protein n=1 Tax=Ganoderma sinense ZZ0214-1 TaxID=1077348 RepID=A0A2G8SIL4_9APHY|nr:hypothetical protein GSI_04019 [Ganoderma sinense ZZ0214-1]
MLRPILRRFITAFDGTPDEAFWKHIMYRDDGLCGKDNLSGWITGFCVWSNKGQWKGKDLPENIPVKPEYAPIPSPHAAMQDPSPTTASTPTTMPASTTMSAPTLTPAPTLKHLDKVVPKWLRRHSKSLIPKQQEKSTKGPAAAENAVTETTSSANVPSIGSIMVPGPLGYDSPAYTLDGVRFFDMPVSSIPPGYCEVDVIVDDDGHRLKCKMVAGHVAFSGTAAPGSDKIDTVSPEAHWFIFERK